MYSRQIWVLLGEFDVEPDVASLAVARSPLRLHASDAPLRNLEIELLLPFRDEIGQRLAQLLPIPAVEVLTPTLRCCALGHVQQQPVALGLEVRATRPLDDLQAAADAPDIVRFAGYHLALGLALCGLQPFTLPLDP